MRSREIATVRIDPMALGVTFEGHRQQERAKLRLPGRYMLANRFEHACTTIDLASCGVAVECGDRGQIGDHVVAYINQLGRMEGEIARQLQNGFAFKIAAPPRKIEKLAVRIAWLVQHDLSEITRLRRSLTKSPNSLSASRRRAMETPHSRGSCSPWRRVDFWRLD